MASYIFKRQGIFYFRRRIPEHLKPYEERTHIKVSLKTKDRDEARRKAAIYNDYIEDYWRSLIKSKGEIDKREQYQLAIKLAKAHGFAYKSVTEIVKAPLEEIVERIEIASKEIDSENTVSSILGGTDKPKLFLNECLDIYWPLCADRLVNKSEHQIRKWKNPRLAAFLGFIDIVGNKEFENITRSDVLTYRQHWMNRLAQATAAANTANKSIIFVRDILITIGNQIECNTDFKHMFSEIKFKEKKQSRASFDASYVQETLLSGNQLDGLNEEAKMLVYGMSDTGARESELIGLRQVDILLEEDIPHIWIRPYENYELKTPQSERKIPLVGASLYCFQKLPRGFSRYKSADSASSAINKYFRENNLKPTPRHSLYSLRHTFKDRLRDIKAPEEIIDELMGHESDGPKYGRGHLLKEKYEWLQRIAFLPI